MMLLRVLSAELLKIRRRMILFLIFLGPFGVISLQALNYGLRYDYLMPLYKDDPWGALIGNVSMLAVPTLFMGLTIIASMTAGIEHQTHAWKQTLALPVMRSHIFLGKFLLNALLLLGSCTLLAAGTIVLGFALGHDLSALPAAELLQWMYYPCLAAMQFFALQAWLSILMHNQAIPLTVGIVGTMASMFSGRFGDWMPYKWVYLSNEANEPLYAVASGLGLGIVVLSAALIAFNRRDVA
jgi:lantibiotic transport system permease protein